MKRQTKVGIKEVADPPEGAATAGKPLLSPLLDGRETGAPACDVSVVIVTFESREVISRCLDSIPGALESLDYEVLVVDNGSGDGTAAWVGSQHPEVGLLENPTNLGYGVANNRALAIARGRFVLLLNPDTELTAGSLQELVSFAEKKEGADIVGCRLLMSDGSIDLACRRSFPTPLVSLYRLLGLSRGFPQSERFGRYNLTYLDPEGTYEVDSVVGAFMLVKRELLLRIGFFDPDFFLYGEDLDLCFRAKEAGATVMYRGEVVAHHIKRASSKKRPLASCYHFHRAMLGFYGKNLKHRYPFWVHGLIRVAVLTRFASALVALSATQTGRQLLKKRSR